MNQGNFRDHPAGSDGYSGYSSSQGTTWSTSSFKNEPDTPADLLPGVRHNLYRDESSVIIIETYMTFPDSKTGPSCVRGAAASLMIIIIFWVQHRSGARATSDKLWRKKCAKTEVRTHRSRGNRASCTWCAAGLGSHWSPGRNMAWEGWTEAGEGSCFLGDESKVSASTHKDPRWISERNQVTALQLARIRGASIPVSFSSAARVWRESSPAMATEASLLPLADSYTDFTIRRLKPNCLRRENRSHTSTLLSLHRPQSSPGPHRDGLSSQRRC